MQPDEYSTRKPYNLLASVQSPSKGCMLEENVFFIYIIITISYSNILPFSCSHTILYCTILINYYLQYLPCCFWNYFEIFKLPLHCHSVVCPTIRKVISFFTKFSSHSYCISTLNSNFLQIDLQAAGDLSHSSIHLYYSSRIVFSSNFLLKGLP